MITAGGAGGNGRCCRLWKVALQELARNAGAADPSRLPPSTSEQNKLEHRRFCHITQNWRSRRLISHDVIVNLIANTTKTGREIRAESDKDTYPTGIEVRQSQIGALHISRPAVTPARTTAFIWGESSPPVSTAILELEGDMASGRIGGVRSPDFALERLGKVCTGGRECSRW